jgi:hypothetical protein
LYQRESKKRAKSGYFRNIFYNISPTHDSVVPFFIIFRQVHFNIVQKNSAHSAHHVPAVYDVLAARIRALRSKDQGRQNVAEQWRGNGA